jgi:hypothetical protein
MPSFWNGRGNGDCAVEDGRETAGAGAGTASATRKTDSGRVAKMAALRYRGNSPIVTEAQ